MLSIFIIYSENVANAMIHLPACRETWAIVRRRLMSFNRESFPAIALPPEGKQNKKKRDISITFQASASFSISKCQLKWTNSSG